jgi:predicted AlkP superfamily phosphohydrolase/phosphomutase
MRVLLLEFNEITWRLLDPLIAAGRVPAFAYLKDHGAWGNTHSVDLGDYLDPWITWTTVYTGTPQEEHGVLFLEQPSETIRAKRIWEIAAEAGLSVGVHGSLNSWPPRPVKGFWIPGTFSQDAATFPKHLQPVQELNLKYTRGYNYGASRGGDGLLWKATMAARLARLGLRLQTALEVLIHMAKERVNSKLAWKRVSLQPLINFDIFSRLYRSSLPDLAMFHTNHVAHYQHLYWRAMQPDIFPEAPSSEESHTYKNAIEHGYQVADRILQRALDLIPADTVLVVASSMGQQPYINRSLKKGKRLLRLRSFEAIVDLLGLEGQIRFVPTMSDQFNIYGVTKEALSRAYSMLAGAYIDKSEQPMFSLLGLDQSMTVNIRQYNGTSEDSVCHFPVGDSYKKAKFGDLVEMFAHTKSGRHDPAGLFMICGPGIQTGHVTEEISTLDLAPTILTLLGLPVPANMRGRAIQQVLGTDVKDTGQQMRHSDSLNPVC